MTQDQKRQEILRELELVSAALKETHDTGPEPDWDIGHRTTLRQLQADLFAELLRLDG